MKFSIVTISFNQREFLEQALASVASQEGVSCEQIVVDPGSSDGSRELISQHASQLASVIFEPDTGPADGLNRGFARATGEIYGFVNADDYLLPNALATVQKAFLSDPGLDIVFGSGLVVSKDGTPQRRLKAQAVDLRKFLHGGSVWLQQSTFFRAEAFRRAGGFNAENRSSWDGELIVSMLKAGAKVGYVAQDLACFRIHGASITGGGASQERWENDRARLFSSVYPEGWTLRHKLLSLFYRSVLLLRNPQRLSHGIRVRLGSHP